MKGILKFIWWLVTALVAVSCTFIGASVVLKGCTDIVRKTVSFI